MKVLVRTKGTEVTDPLRDYAENKLQSMEKYFDEETEGNVLLRVESGVHIAELTVHFHSYYLRAEQRSEDMYLSIDKALENLERQYLKHKDKLDRKHRARGVKKVNQDTFQVDSEPIVEDEGIIRRKSFQLKPMTEEEAIMQMDMLGHTFFVFTNAANGNVNVIYSRNDGRYGIIESEL